MITDRLIKEIIRKKNPSVAGIDTAFSYLPESLRAGVSDNAGAAKRIFQFNREIIDGISDLVPAVKIQAAYYEAYGPDGMAVMRDTIQYSAGKGLITITDVKRNDIGATSAAYSAAYLGVNDAGIKAAFESDYITVNGYLGLDGIKPFTDDAAKYGKGIFVLIRTSNPSSAEIQNLKTESGACLYEVMGGLVAKWGGGNIGSYGYSAAGGVVGATHKAEAERLRAQLPSVFFLVPGYGAQGGTANDLEVCFDKRGLGAIVNSSRGILCAYQKKKGLAPGEAARQAVIEMREDIVSALVEKGKTEWLS